VPIIRYQPLRSEAPNAAQHVAERQNEARRRQCGHEHARDVKETPGGDHARGAETVGEIPEERREDAHQQHRQRVGERPQLAPDFEVGGDRFLKYAEALPRADPDRQVNAVLIAIENRVRLSERIGQFMN